MWQCADATKLEGVQRKGLALCLGAIGNSGREALEVELNVNPLEVRRTELSLRETARILSKDVSEAPGKIGSAQRRQKIHFTFLENTTQPRGYQGTDRKQTDEPGARLLFSRELISNHQHARILESSRFFKKQDTSSKR